LIPPFLFFLTLHISYNWCRRRHQAFRTWWDSTVERCPPHSSPARRPLSPSTVSSHGAQPQTSPHTAFLIVGLVVLVAINILFIVDIELTLRRNKGDQNGEDEWGFGQILALLLLIIPLRDAWGALQEIQEKLKESRERLKDFHQDQFEKLLLSECQATPVFQELRRLIGKGANPRLWSADIKFGCALQLIAYYGKIEL
ncbi:hypothetical protein DFH09DRAFT_1046739, partial [Mycena vulgaris]